MEVLVELWKCIMHMVALVFGCGGGVLMQNKRYDIRMVPGQQKKAGELKQRPMGSRKINGAQK